MVIELHGAGFTNKGAQLMLMAAIQELNNGGNTRFAVPAQQCSFSDRARHDLRLVMAQRRPIIGRRSAAYALRRPFLRAILNRASRESAGIVFGDDIDALVDISGYAFGDHWGPWAALNLASHTEELNRPYRPRIMLSQMFGPFKNRFVAKAVHKLIDRMDRVYARDTTSYEALLGLGGRADHIAIAPDITIGFGLTQVKPPPKALPDRDYICIVPNMRVIDKAGAQWQGGYGEMLELAAAEALDAGLRVEVVVHELAGPDALLAEKLVRSTARPGVKLRTITDPLEFKRIAAGARFVIASRFHAAVSALSVGTPTATLGWAHKYRGLMENFGVPELDCTIGESVSGFRQRLETLLDDSAWAKCHARILDAREALLSDSATMWGEVRSLLGYPSLTKG